MAPRSVVAATVAIVLAGVSACSAGAAPPPAGPTVVRVVDGDTVVVRIGGVDETIRLLGIDTPEVAHHDEPGECWGTESAAVAAALLPSGTAVEVWRDTEPRDRYGRLLGYVRAGDVLVNLALVDAGAAEVLSIEPNTALAGPLASAQHAARRDGRGLWGACG